jgi:hypothetical protein
MTWEDIKAQLITLYAKYVSNNGFIEPDSGNPTELALFVDLVHQQVNSNPGMPDYFKRKVGQTITLTGASSYNLRTLFPDYIGLYQVYGVNDYQDQLNVSQSTNNLLRQNESYSVTNGILYFAEGYPQTGTLKIDYMSAYMVEDSSGNRKKFFTDETDVSVLLPNHIWVILMGVGQYVNWKADNASKAQRDFVQAQFNVAEQSLFLHQEQQNAIGSFLY